MISYEYQYVSNHRESIHSLAQAAAATVAAEATAAAAGAGAAGAAAAATTTTTNSMVHKRFHCHGFFMVITHATNTSIIESIAYFLSCSLHMIYKIQVNLWGRYSCIWWVPEEKINSLYIIMQNVTSMRYWPHVCCYPTRTSETIWWPKPVSPLAHSMACRMFSVNPLAELMLYLLPIRPLGKNFELQIGFLLP